MKDHNRYLIYRLLGRKVDIRLPARFGGQRIQGIVEKVCRDIFGNTVVITIDSYHHTFKEPQAIVEDKDAIVFLYGDIDAKEPDTESFEVPSYNAYDESLNEHLFRTRRQPVSRTVINMGEVEISPSSRWRSRVAV